MMDMLAHNTDIWVFVSFVIFLTIAVKAGKGAITEMIDARIAGIEKELIDAENLHTEAQQLLAQYQRKHKNALAESEEIIANAEKYAAEIRKAAKQELTDTTKRREAQLEDRIARMKDAAIADIQAYAAEIAIDATREIIAKEFDTKAEQAFTNDAITSIGSKAA